MILFKKLKLDKRRRGCLYCQKLYVYLFFDLQILLARIKYKMEGQQTINVEQINQDLQKLLTTQEEKLKKTQLNNKSKRNQAASIINQYKSGKYQYQSKNTTSNTEQQNVNNKIGIAFAPFNSELKNQNINETKIEFSKQPDDVYRKLIQQTDEMLNKKQERINILEADLKQKDRQISQMTENHQLQLAQKQRVNLILQTKLQKSRKILQQLHTTIIMLKQELQCLKMDCKKQVPFQAQQQKIIGQFKIIQANISVKLSEKITKENQKTIQKANSIYQSLQIYQRDLARMAGFSINQQLTIQQRIKAFNQQLEIYIKYSNTFSDSSIAQAQNQKKWLLQKVCETIGGRSFKTRLIYKFDSLNKTNFHRYIDDRPNIMLLVKLENGYKIGSFCKTPIEKSKVEKHKDGFLFSLTLQEKYQPKTANQALVSYDDYFLIFGNAQIRIKTLQSKVYSNFGATAGMFATYGKKVVDFLGQANNQIALAHYQIYELTKDQI